MIRSNKESSSSKYKTTSEQLFEQYLGLHGIHFEYEVRLSGKKKCPDFCLDLPTGKKVFCEVKELRPNKPLPPGARCFDPYHGIRKRIEKARQKFAEYRNACCVLVIQNINDWDFRDDPYVVFGAMLGDVGFSIPFDEKLAALRDKEQRQAFLDGGKTRHRKQNGTAKPQNTTISALAVLEDFPPSNVEFEKEYQKRISSHRQNRDSDPSIEVELQVRIELYDVASPNLARRPRVTVFENPYARLPLPDSIFTGEYDRRYRANPSSTRISRVFAGSGLLLIEAQSQINLNSRIGEFVDFIREKYDPVKIVLFGSHAYGSVDDGSDVDLLVILRGKGDQSHLSIEMLQQLSPRFPLDLLVRSEGEVKRRLEQNDSFMHEIIEKGKVLYEA